VERAAAFFDLDRTLIRRSSALALAPAFRAAGLISRRQLAKAAAWQVLFMVRGASHEAVKRAAVDGLEVLRGFTPEELQALVADSMERVLRPLVYAESLDLVERHRRRGEPVYIVSATLQEIVDAIADDLRFDGALGTVCEVVDGRYTDEQAVWALTRFADEPAERVPSRQITRVQLDEPRGSGSIERGEFDREVDRLNQEEADQ